MGVIRVRSRLVWLALGLLVGSWPACARGQIEAAEQPAEPRSPPASSGQATVNGPNGQTPRSTAGPAVEASQLDTFLLRDSKGNLVPVLGLSFEEFEQLLRLKRGLVAPPAPTYSLERLSVVGTADERLAELTVTATIRVRQEGWVRVPLEMASVVMRQPATYEGPGEHFIAFDEQSGGYICWLSGNDARPHVVTLAVAVSVAQVGDERRVAIDLPRATESSLRLTTAGTNLDASLSAGDGLVSMRAAGDERTEITVLGAGGAVQLAWRPGRMVKAKGPAQFDASGEITVRIESEHRITSDARLRVRSFGGPLERFRVRLPPGMELVSLPASGGYQVAPASPATDAKSKAKSPPSQVVEVRLDRPATAPLEISLRAQRQADGAAAAALTPARFEVLGAVRQRGTIDFVMDGEWQLEWNEDKSVHRLDVTPEAAAARVVARFEYFRQPCGLELKVAGRPSRVSVEPSHVLHVDPQRVRVETTLKYRFRGARAAGLKFELGDWTLDRLTPDALFDFPVQSPGNHGELNVPFRAGAALPPELELKLEAHQALPDAPDQLSLTLPRPVGDVIAPATVMIMAADNVELSPRVAELMGLAPDAAPLRLTGRQQQPLVYRDLGGGEPAVFVADMRTLRRITTAACRASVRVDRQQARVEQRLEYRVLHEPRRSFTLLAPRELAAGGELELWYSDELLALNPVTGAAADPLMAALQFSLPVDQIGAFQVAVRYAVPLRWERAEPVTLKLPLVVPLDGEEDQITGQRVEFSLAEGLQISPDEEQADDAVQPTTSGGGHAYFWSRPPVFSQWIVEPSAASEAAPIHIAKMWVQTWLAPQIRQERVAMSLSTLQETIRLQLPKGVRQASVQTAIDGQDVPRSLRPTSVAIVSVPPSARGRTCVLEVAYALDSPRSRLGMTSETLRTVRIDEAAAPRRVYWQLVLPQDEHLLATPEEWAAEMAWSSAGPLQGLVGRRPVMDQRQLEAWIKASAQESLPRGVNEYLFGTLGRWPTLPVICSHRRVIVPLASVAVLIVGLLLVHVPQLRSPSFLLVVAVALGAGAVAAPDLALLLARAATFGLLVAAGAAAWAWLATSRRMTALSSASTAPVRVRESPSTQPPSPRERSSRVTSTAAAAPMMEVRP
jgi:hypothetical protein